MKPIVQIKFGSHLYGTATPQSDLDIIGVYVPSERDILLQKVAPVISQSRSKEHGEKNSHDDVDINFYSLQRYLELLAEGQTVALDILFAPDWAMIVPPDPVWQEVQAIAPQLLTKGATAFVRYCRQQANKYGIKGSRVSAARVALTALQDAEKSHGAHARLEMAQDILRKTITLSEFISFSSAIDHLGNTLHYFEVCGKKTLMSASIKSAREIVQRLVDEYGQRALAAERNEGVDWKALSHAIRVGHEALELFQTGRITFPRPEAQHLLAVKQGRVLYADVAKEIEDLLIRVEASAETSTFPDRIDQTVINDLVSSVYRNQIAGAHE